MSPKFLNLLSYLSPSQPAPQGTFRVIASCCLASLLSLASIEARALIVTQNRDFSFIDSELRMGEVPVFNLFDNTPLQFTGPDTLRGTLLSIKQELDVTYTTSVAASVIGDGIIFFGRDPTGRSRFRLEGIGPTVQPIFGGILTINCTQAPFVCFNRTSITFNFQNVQEFNPQNTSNFDALVQAQSFDYVASYLLGLQGSTLTNTSANDNATRFGAAADFTLNGRLRLIYEYAPAITQVNEPPLSALFGGGLLLLGWLRTRPNPGK